MDDRSLGVVHQEFHSERFTRNGGTLEMVQLWVNLPANEKMSPPRYQGLLDADIPRVQLAAGAGMVRVIAGDFQGTKGAARTFTPINLWDVQLADEVWPFGRSKLTCAFSAYVKQQCPPDMYALQQSFVGGSGVTESQLSAQSPATKLDKRQISCHGLSDSELLAEGAYESS